MKFLQHRILIAIGLLMIAGSLVSATASGSNKYKINDSTVLPFKDKAELVKGETHFSFMRTKSVSWSLW